MELTIVTFIHNKETVNVKLLDLLNFLRTVGHTVRLVIYTDNAVNANVLTLADADIVVDNGATKYKRILHSIENAACPGILYIDNDITPDNINLQAFLSGIDENTDIAWGYIGVTENHGFMSKLITVDKLLSHKVIRPLLWKLNIGISVPGQIFYINKTKFKKDMPRYDTVFDDLTIGICAKQFGYSTKRFSYYLGYEKPAISFRGLIGQRLRWAKGFSQSIINNVKSKMLPNVLIHGFCYHLLWLPVWTVIILSIIFGGIWGVLPWFLTCFYISGMKCKLAGYALIYMIIFPFIHLVWLFGLIYYTAPLSPKTKFSTKRFTPTG